MQLAFGTGILYGVALLDAAGAAVANPTPVQFGAMQDISADISFEQKMLYGSYQFPIAVGRGKGKLEFKAKNANINAAMMGNLLFGLPVSAGIKDVIQNSPQTVPTTLGVTGITVAVGGTSYVVGDIVTVNTGTSTVKATAVVTTVSAGVVTGLQVVSSGNYSVAPSAAGATTGGTGTGLTVNCTTTTSGFVVYAPGPSTFATDLGVVNVGTGLPLTRVASAPASGQYTVTAGGIYAFAAADQGQAVLASFEYSAASTTGPKYVNITNQLMGYAPTFKAALDLSYLGKSMTLMLNNCISSKFSLPFKNDDFAIPEFDFAAFADASGNIGYMALAE